MRNDRSVSSTKLGNFVFPISFTPALGAPQAENTIEYGMPFSCTFVVHVVQPGVWPGVQTARNVVPPNVTVSPSFSMRSTLTGSQPSSPNGDLSIPDDSAAASSPR